ncbi:MAG: hypothetical protein WB973_16845 [Thermoanaerobaculia bacterium]
MAVTSLLNVTPAQAQWIVERLIADRRISHAEVRSIFSDLDQEIAQIEQRLAALRSAAATQPVASPAPRRRVQSQRPEKRASGRKKGHVRGIAGTLAVLLRSIPAAEHAAIAAIRADQGIKAAIRAATQAAAKKS